MSFGRKCISVTLKTVRRCIFSNNLVVVDATAFRRLRITIFRYFAIAILSIPLRHSSVVHNRSFGSLAQEELTNDHPDASPISVFFRRLWRED